MIQIIFWYLEGPTFRMLDKLVILCKNGKKFEYFLYKSLRNFEILINFTNLSANLYIG